MYLTGNAHSLYRVLIDEIFTDEIPSDTFCYPTKSFNWHLFGQMTSRYDSFAVQMQKFEYRFDFLILAGSK